MCKYFQESVKELSLDFYNTLRRHNYVTPTSYLELILTFKTLLNSKRQEVDMIRSRYLTGLQKLEFAASQVRTPCGAVEAEVEGAGAGPGAAFGGGVGRGRGRLVQVPPSGGAPNIPACRAPSRPPPTPSTLSCLYSRFW